MVSARQLLAILTKDEVHDLIRREFRSCPPFTEQEIQDFLDGKEGQYMGALVNPMSRSAQVRRCISLIGASLIDTKLADIATIIVYRELWDLKFKSRCTVCGTIFTTKLMFRSDVCSNGSCQGT